MVRFRISRRLGQEYVSGTDLYRLLHYSTVVSRTVSKVAKLNKLVRPLHLENGESVKVWIDPEIEVTEEKGQRGGSTFSIPVTLQNGKAAILRGGSRMVDAVLDCFEGGAVPIEKRSLCLVKATGDAGSVERQWEVKVVPP